MKSRVPLLFAAASVLAVLAAADFAGRSAGTAVRYTDAEAAVVFAGARVIHDTVCMPAEFCQATLDLEPSCTDDSFGHCPAESEVIFSSPEACTLTAQSAGHDCQTSGSQLCRVKYDCEVDPQRRTCFITTGNAKVTVSGAVNCSSGPAGPGGS